MIGFRYCLPLVAGTLLSCLGAGPLAAAEPSSAAADTPAGLGRPALAVSPLQLTVEGLVVDGGRALVIAHDGASFSVVTDATIAGIMATGIGPGLRCHLDRSMPDAARLHDCAAAPVPGATEPLP